jgi:predicted HTH transcriptional regulator
MGNKRVVVMVVPAASKIPTGFDGNRYLRIGSSKVNLNK